MARKPYTGVVPIRYEGSEAMQCEPHRAHGWQPIINGKPVKADGHVLRYVTKADALASLATALRRRTGPPGHNYKLGKRMEQPK